MRIFHFFSFFFSFLSSLTVKREFAESLSQLLLINNLTSLFDLYSQWKVFKLEENRSKFKTTIFERTNCVLQLIINIAPFLTLEAKPILSDFVNLVLEKRHIEPHLKDFITKSENYYNGKLSKDEEIVDLQFFYQNLANLITCYAKLLRFKDITIFEFREEAIYRTCASQVLNLLNYAKIDPKVLSSCSNFLFELLRHPNLENDGKILVNIAGFLMDFLPLLWFLGGNYYETLCMMGTLYYKPIKNDDEEIEFSEFINEQRVLVIQEAFFHIIRVFKFLSNFKAQNSKGTKTAIFCADLCGKLNFLKERNPALFRSYEIPNDNVKLMVCRTFCCIFPGGWAIEEIKALQEIVKGLKDFKKKNSDEVCFKEIFFCFMK